MRNHYRQDHERGATIEIGETHVTIREPSGRVRTALILEKSSNRSGKLVGLLLDRIVHEEPNFRFDGWTAAGCFVTELHLDKKKAE
jgi:hypothetical protein